MAEYEEVASRAAQVKPTARQLAWQRLEYTAFAHFGVNTFTDQEWGDGSEDPAIFNPTELDAGQWAQACRDAGMEMLIVTAKHHDGFCLWPSARTEHSVKNSPWRNGKGDVVGEAAEVCRQAGLKFGVYCSPWDRHEPTYGDSPAYNDYFRAQLRELLTNYGEVAEVWFDGACAEGPNGKRQEYDWVSYYEVARELQPEAVIAICGPDVRWVGNESGLWREDEWSVVPAGASSQEKIAANFLDFDAQERDLGSRERLAQAENMIWYPAECDVSIRPGWFYHASQDLQVKSLDHMLDIYYRSVGRNSVLLLNVPPDRRGLFHENDVARLKELRAVLDATYGEDLARGANATADSAADAAGKVVDGEWDSWWQAADATATIELDLGAEKRFDRLLLQEPIERGQQIEKFALEGWHGGEWKPIVSGGSVGYKRLERFSAVSVQKVRLRIEQARSKPALRTVGLHLERGR